MTTINTQFLSLSFIHKTRLDEVYPVVFIALRIILNCPDTVALKVVAVTTVCTKLFFSLANCSV